MLATPALFFEYEDVLSRPAQREVHGRSIDEIELLMRNFATVIVPVQVHFQWRPQLTDANDERVLEAAINGRADSIITTT
jgi:predicted nucleic acid-binding protein